MQEYYRQWQFKHPQPEDFKKVLETTSGKNLDSLFSLLDKKGILPNQQRTGTKTVFAFDIKSYAAYLRNPVNNLISIGPSVGINRYDKFMIGAFVTNYKLPASRFQFFLAPDVWHRFQKAYRDRSCQLFILSGKSFSENYFGIEWINFYHQQILQTKKATKHFHRSIKWCLL